MHPMQSASQSWFIFIALHTKHQARQSHMLSVKIFLKYPVFPYAVLKSGVFEFKFKMWVKVNMDDSTYKILSWL